MTKGDWHDLNRLEQRALVLLTILQDAHMGNDDFEKWAKILHAKNLAQGIVDYIERMYMDDVPTDE